MTQKELDVILEKHKKWLYDEEGGERAVLDNEILDGLNLDGASLNRASLDGASLDGASLNRASLDGASLDGASLYGASLNRASLDGASLNGASLDGASLNGASLDGAKNIPFIPMACPDTNGFTGFKKVRIDKVYIIELYIPANAKRSSATGRKCRCEFAKVKKIEVLENGECKATDVKTVINDNYGHKTVYKTGETVYPDSYDENRFNECSNGIHFFINKQEAIDY